MARAANALGATLIHYSSDFVFDGLTPSPRREEDPANPRSVYAASKLLGEWFAADVSPHYVLRVESLFGGVPDGPPAKGTVASIIKALREGRMVKVFSARTVSPTFVIDAARATCDVIDRHPEPGLYHCVNSGHCTWLEFATEAALLLGVDPTFDVVRFADVLRDHGARHHVILGRLATIEVDEDVVEAGGATRKLDIFGAGIVGAHCQTVGMREGRNG